MYNVICDWVHWLQSGVWRINGRLMDHDVRMWVLGKVAAVGELIPVVTEAICLLDVSNHRYEENMIHNVTEKMSCVRTYEGRSWLFKIANQSRRIAYQFQCLILTRIVIKNWYEMSRKLFMENVMNLWNL